MRALLTAFLLGAALPAQAQVLFLNDASVVVDGETVTRDVIVDGGELRRVGETLQAPGGATTVEGAWVTPGLFAIDSTLGLVEVSSEAPTNDASAETAVSSVADRASDAFNPRSVHVPIVRRQGITHALVLPRPKGDTIFGGTGMIASTSGAFDSIVADGVAVHVALGEGGSGLAGGSRAAAMTQLRGALQDAAANRTGRDESNVLTPQDAAALRAVLDGDAWLAVRASRASDLLSIARLARNYPGLRVIVFGAEEAHLVVDELSGTDIHFVVDPLNNLPDSFQSVGADFANFTALHEAGLPVAIANTSSLGVTRAQALRQHAGNAVARGADWHDAFAAISDVPAAWFGIEDTGLVVWDGDPLEVTSGAIHMILDGEAMSLSSRQTRLRDRYNPAIEDDRPYGYR